MSRGTSVQQQEIHINLLQNNDVKWRSIKDNDDLFQRTSFGVAVYKQRYIIVVGGNCKSSKIKSFIYDTKSLTYQTMPNLYPLFLFNLGCVIIDDFLYIMASGAMSFFILKLQLTSSVTSTISFKYPATKIWIPIIQPQTFISDGVDFFVLGREGDFQRYKNHDKEWEVLPSMKIPCTSYATAIVGDTIYRIGGLHLHKKRRTLASVEKFHIPTQSWQMSPSLPHPISNCSAAVVKDRFIVVTGGFRDRKQRSYSSTVFIFDTRSKLWSYPNSHPGKENSKSKLLQRRYGHKCFSVGKLFFSLGGLSPGGIYDDGFFSLDVRFLIPNLDKVLCLVLLRELAEKGRAIPDDKIQKYNSKKSQTKSQIGKTTTVNVDNIIREVVMNFDMDLFRFIISFMH